LPQTNCDWEPSATQAAVVPPLQQPAAHEFALHEQVPFVLSQTLFPHGPHEAPPVPHDDADSDA
jgi:hypothetical protein